MPGSFISVMISVPLIASTMLLEMSALTEITQVTREKQAEIGRQISCVRVFGDETDPPAKCTETGLNDGGFLALNVVYLTPVIAGSCPFSVLSPLDSSGHYRSAVPAMFSTATDIQIGRQKIPVGVYGLYVAPEDGGWQLILNRQILKRGEKYDPAQEIGRFDLRRAVSPEAPPETFRVRFVPVIPRPIPVDEVRRNPELLVYHPVHEMHLIWGTENYYVVIAAAEKAQ